MAVLEQAVEETTLPRFVRFRGKRVRVIGYTPKDGDIPARFCIVDVDDSQRNVHRSQITFIKQRSSK